MKKEDNRQKKVINARFRFTTPVCFEKGDTIALHYELTSKGEIMNSRAIVTRHDKEMPGESFSVQHEEMEEEK